jgi:hypothetical protein
VLKGYIDGIASSGYIAGWAFDAERPLDPLAIGILDEHEQEIAWGLAHLYREDLSAAGCAAGWCAFRVRTAASVSRLRKQALTLIGRSSKQAIVRRFPVPYTEDWDGSLRTIAEVVASDPTTITSIVQLKGCDDIFGRFMYTHGIDAFIRAAYVYALGRPADASGLASYGQKIRKNLLTPFQLLEIMTDSDEFRSRPRLLAAPNTNGFPFRQTADV